MPTGSVFPIGNDDDEWVSDCERGPVRVSLQMRSGKVSEATTRVAGHWRSGAGGVTDLGLVPARDAADAMLALREHFGRGRGRRIDHRGDAGGQRGGVARAAPDGP